MCDDHTLKITGISIININMFNGTIRIIHELQHVKSLKKNLLSLGQIDNLSSKTHVENVIMKIVRDVLMLIKTEKISVNLFMIKRKTL